jgi:lipopolysaccharide/colanic/teichoic acid biosynthesis glycosyltransferase
MLGTQRALKRLLDIGLSLAAGIALSPALAIIAAAIRVTSGKPVLYRWPVVGQNGRPLKAYKFRTMIVDADRIKAALQEKNEATGPVFKMRNDPRVTRVGRLLRKFSLDELPQLWSVLKGDMSLVGPRPVLLSEWRHFTEAQRRKLSVKPGAVCLWHISGQPRDFESWIRLDLEYVERWSLWLDIRILCGAFLYLAQGRNC